jgi:hypothetical protein
MLLQQGRFDRPKGHFRPFFRITKKVFEKKQLFSGLAGGLDRHLTADTLIKSATYRRHNEHLRATLPATRQGVDGSMIEASSR